jgi:hypothetical protein
MHRATRSLLSFCLEAIADVAPERVLDLDLGFGRWGMLVRELCDDAAGRVHRENWRTHVEAITPHSAGVEEYHHFFYDWIHVGDALQSLTGMTDRWSLTVLGELLRDQPPATAQELLAAVLDRSDYVLMLVPLASEAGDSAPGHPEPAWTASALLALEPTRYALQNVDGQDHGAFLLSRADPLGLRRPQDGAEVFSRIVDDNLWEGSESRSAPGSALIQTAVIRRSIPALIAKVGARSILDVPCGEFNWLRHVNLPVHRYIGADIAPATIARNQLRFGNEQRTFLVLDARSDALPRADMILCRDALVHLPFEEAFRVLASFRRSGSVYVLTTTFPNLERNLPLETDGWRPLNLRLPPFFFPEPLAIINEGCTEGGGRYADKSLALWKLAEL